jgi:DNA primase
MSHELDIINKTHKITDYLLQHGVRWVSHDNQRYKYNCPLPNHRNDKTPSFFVFDKGHSQDFYCFGCKTSGFVVQLVAAYEQIPLKNAIQKLSQGLNIKIDDVIDSIIKDISIYINTGDDDEKAEAIYANSLFISSHMYNFLRKVDFNQNDLEIAEKVFKLTDSLVFVENVDDLEKLVKTLPAKTKCRYDLYVEKKKQENIQKIKESNLKL